MTTYERPDWKASEKAMQSFGSLIRQGSTGRRASKETSDFQRKTLENQNELQVDFSELPSSLHMEKAPD